MKQLFAFYIGGKAKHSLIELHDVQLVVAESLEDCFPVLRRRWFGLPESLHIDAWFSVDVIDGHSVQVVSNTDKQAQSSGKTLFFINLGGYDPAQFTELHYNQFYVASTIQEAKARAKADWLGAIEQRHTDNAWDVEACYNVEDLISSEYALRIQATEQSSTPVDYHCAYFKLPPVKSDSDFREAALS